MYRRNYSFGMNVIEEITEIRSCIVVWQIISKSTQLIIICSTVNTDYYKVYILGDLHPLRGSSG